MQREVYSLFVFYSRLAYWAKEVGSLVATTWGTRYRLKLDFRCRCRMAHNVKGHRIYADWAGSPEYLLGIMNQCAEHPTTSYSGCLGLGYAPYRSAAFCLPSLSKCCQPAK